MPPAPMTGPLKRAVEVRAAGWAGENAAALPMQRVTMAQENFCVKFHGDE
jgi:hypothetical protein